jgi:hypothetical protein
MGLAMAISLGDKSRSGISQSAANLGGSPCREYSEQALSLNQATRLFRILLQCNEITFARES